MNREKLKSKVERYCKNNLELRLICDGLFCPDCPLYIKNNDEERCARDDDEVKEVLGEVWAETHGYVKKEKLRPKVNEEFIDNLAALLQRGATFSVIKNVICCEGELWMGQDDQEDNWYRWLKENLFVEDTEDEELEQSNEETESTVPINLGEVQSQEQFPFDDIPVSDLTIPIPQPTTPELKWGFLKETLKVLIQEERSQAQKEAYQKILKIIDGFDGVA
ncbi:hypothetical protein AAK706_04515 [Erysipelotrichaceae bacterium 66-17]